MAGETGIVNSEWVQGGIGIAIAIISGVALRLGWVKGKDSAPESNIEVAGAVVDSRAVKVLVDAIDHAVDRVTDLHDMRVRHDKRILEENDDLREDIKELTRAIRSLVQQKETPHA